jgi:hypothetical protein
MCTKRERLSSLQQHLTNDNTQQNDKDTQSATFLESDSRSAVTAAAAAL